MAEILCDFSKKLSNCRSLKAKRVLKLTKPVRPSKTASGSSANYIWSYEQRRRLLASYLRLETFANKASPIPKELYGRLNFNLGAVDFDLLEFEVHGHQMESLLAQMLGWDSEEHKKCHEKLAGPIDALLSRLNITYHSGLEDGEGFLHWTLMESVEKFWSFDTNSARAIKGRLPFCDFLTRRLVNRPLKSAGLMEVDKGSVDRFQWFHQLPLVNVDIRWANSMGFLTKASVTGQISTTFDGPISWTRDPILSIKSHLNPT